VKCWPVRQRLKDLYKIPPLADFYYKFLANSTEAKGLAVSSHPENILSEIFNRAKGG
jgi:formate dehydrogenase maturation protein FdhE